MHRIQEKLLGIINKKNISGIPLRDIGGLINEHSPQKIKHHLTQLSKKGFITYDSKNRIIKKNQRTSNEGLILLPVVGSANCGPANIFAEENIIGHLKVSRKIAPKNNKVFVLKAEGNSMNKCDIKGKNIEDGDFVLIDPTQKIPAPGQYVVSIIDGMANIKKFIPDPENDRIILKSESKQNYLPIFIHKNDAFHISGTVIDVIKNQK